MTHLKFERFGFDNKKTFVWEVRSSYDDTLLGLIKWFPPWRQYVFYPNDGCVWSDDCLMDLSKFITEHKKDRLDKGGING